MRKLHVAAFVATLFVAAGIAPSFADGSAVNAAAVKATIASGTATLATSGTQVAIADFGSPPSGEIPIIYNDRHVYANPDRLKQNRVLAVIVKNGVIMVPLRSMFEEMGAQVTYDAASKSVTAQKPGASVQVTLGKTEAVINGEARPLDVPPEMYKGVLVVPIRVMSEALGAYVQWVPDRRIAVVRYIPPTPIPTAPPTIAPTPVPTLPPTPTPKPFVYRGFAQAGLTSGRVYNEFAAGQKDVGGSYVIAGAYKAGEFAAKIDFRQDTFNSTINGVVPGPNDPNQICHTSLQASPGAQLPGDPTTVFSTIDGGMCYTPPFRGKDANVDIRAEYTIARPWLGVGVSYGQFTTSYGYPVLRGEGIGLEALPNLDPKGGFTWFGSYFYYPNMVGTYQVNDPMSSNFGNKYRERYGISKYDIGVSYIIGNSPIYVYGGFSGNRMQGQATDIVSCSGLNPASTCPGMNGQTYPRSHSGPYLGLGLRF